MTRSRSIILALALAALPFSAPVSGGEGSAPTVGMEGRIRVELPHAGLCAKGVGPRQPVILRVVSAEGLSDGRVRYDLRFTGMEPGEHDLATYLVHADGSPVEGLEPIPVSIRSLLPNDHDGMLSRLRPSLLERAGGYRMIMWGLWAIWVLALLPLVFLGRARRIADAPTPDVPEPTIEERLRELVQRAEGLTVDEKRRFEGLLLLHWRQGTAMEESDFAQAIPKLRDDPRVGPLLTTVESWLHRPGGQLPDDVERLVALDPSDAASRAGEGES